MFCKEKCQNLISSIEKLEWFPILLARVSVGYVFLESGWGKLHNLSQVIEFFTGLGIPFAFVQAPFVAALEFIGGGMLILGIATRWISFPLIMTMIVAIITAKRDSIESLTDLLGMEEFLFIVLLLWLVARGSGYFSIERFICKNKTN